MGGLHGRTNRAFLAFESSIPQKAQNQKTELKLINCTQMFFPTLVQHGSIRTASCLYLSLLPELFLCINLKLKPVPWRWSWSHWTSSLFPVQMCWTSLFLCFSPFCISLIGALGEVIESAVLGLSEGFAQKLRLLFFFFFWPGSCYVIIVIQTVSLKNFLKCIYCTKKTIPQIEPGFVADPLCFWYITILRSLSSSQSSSHRVSYGFITAINTMTKSNSEREKVYFIL